MKLRKLFAGVAAAATLLGGMAFGATTANAAEPQTITLSGATAANTTYTAYKIGTYDTAAAVQGTEVDALASIGVKTEAAWKTDAENVLGSTVTNTKDYKAYGDPLAYVSGTSAYGTANSAELTAFVDGLSGKTVGKTAAGTPQSVTTDNATVTFEGLEEGLYLVVATKDSTDPAESAGKALAIIGTKVTVNGTEYSKLNNTDLGVAEVKPSTPQKPGKEGEVVDGTDVYVGKKIKYTLTGTVPQYVDDTFTFIDTPGVGLTVTVNKTNVKVFHGANKTAVPDADYTLTPNDGSEVSGKSDGSATFKVALNNPSQYKGELITVEYEAVVNAEATDKVNNSVKFDDPTSQITDNEKQVKKNTIKFTKVGVDADVNGLKGVSFTLTADSTENNVGLPAGYQTTATTDENGKIEFINLPNGTYTISETTPASGYMDTKTKFTVTVKDGNITQFTGDTLGLATQETEGITVKNVKKITQLPLTGAAGTMLFTVIAVLLAGAAATVFAKSRSTKRMLNA